MTNKLNILSGEGPQQPPGQHRSHTASKRHELQAKFDRLWLTEPEQFNPLRNCMERQRLQRTWDLITQRITLPGKQAVDLGCGTGIFAKKMRDGGAAVDAVDISNLPLKILLEQDSLGITVKQDCMPHTKLDDDSYDLVVSLDLIGYIPDIERRLYFSELARLVKSDAFVVCSTSLDINTEDPLAAFGSLAETEFAINAWKFSYHALHIRIYDFFKAPERLAKGWKDASYRKRQISQKKSLSKWWYHFNSSPALGWLWAGLQYISHPLITLLENNESLLGGLEKICRFLWNESGISHAIFIGQRRPIVLPSADEMLAIEPKHKRQVWE